MMYKIILKQEDFLNYQLFTASKSKQTRKKRISTWLILTGLMLSIGFVALQKEEKFLAYYFLIFGIITLVFYPYYQRIQYKKHFLKHIIEHYQNRFGAESELGFKNGFIINSSDEREGKIKLSEIDIINEIDDNVFIKIKTGESVIVPKRAEGYDELKQELQKIATNLDIQWNEELEWKWK